MFSAAEEVIFALRTQGMSQKGIAARVGCSQSMFSHILKKDFPAPVNNGGRPKKTSSQDDRALKKIAHSNRFKSTTSITHLWNETMTSPVSRSTTYRRLRFHGFSSRISCTKPLLSCKQKKKRLQFAQKYSKWTVEDWKQVIFSDESKFVMGYGNKMATRDLVFGGKSTKGTRRLVWSVLSSIRPPLWSGDVCHPEELEVCASCLPRRQSTRRCISIC